MSATFSAIEGCGADWFDGKSSRRTHVRLTLVGDDVHVIAPDASGETTIARVARSTLRIPSRIGRSPYRLEFPDGSLAICADAPVLERMLGLDASGHWLPRLERASAVVVIALFGLIAAVYVAYQRVIPFVADFAAQRIPRESEDALGDIALDSLERFGFKSTFLSDAEQKSIEADFEELAKAAGLHDVTSLQFRRAPPNALALPGGTVVVSDPLVALFRTDRRMLRAVLAHELGHQAHRDGLRHILTGSFSAVVMGTVAGDVSGVAALTVTVPALATTLHHKRSVEAEADSYAFDLLKKTGVSPKDFADAMRRMRAMSQCVSLRMADRRAADRAPGPMYEPYQDDWNELSASSKTPVRPPAPCFSDPNVYLTGRDADIKALDLSSGPLLYLRTHPIDTARIEAAEAAAAAK
jgi:Zn-dependent protease with chaperone function